MANTGKIVAYTANIITKPLAKTIDKLAGFGLSESLNFGSGLNIYGGAYFALVDLLGACSDKIKDSWFTRMSKVAGTAIYGGSFISDIVQVANGDIGQIPKTVLDGLMTYQLGKDTLRQYNGTGEDLWDDVRFKH